jgi:hypothetical protein
MKKPSPYPLISWAMDLKLTPALNSIRDRHAQAAAVPAAAVDDDLKVGGNKKATPSGVAFFYDGGVDRLRSSAFKGFGVQGSTLLAKGPLRVYISLSSTVLERLSKIRHYDTKAQKKGI